MCPKGWNASDQTLESCAWESVARGETVVLEKDCVWPGEVDGFGFGEGLVGEDA